MRVQHRHQLFLRAHRRNLVYDDNPELYEALCGLEGLPIACLLSYGISTSLNSIIPPRVPALLHLTRNVESLAGLTVYSYPGQSNQFALPQTSDYDPGNAAMAHSRSLVFLRKWLGGPIFDLEAIWDEHCYFEFEVRSVAKTMATMVVSVRVV